MRAHHQGLAGRGATPGTWRGRAAALGIPSAPLHPAVADALAAGDITVDHARVMVGCLRTLSPDWQDAAQTELLTVARDHDPAMLAALCRELRVRSGADESLEEAAQRQYDSRHLTLAATINGMLSINGMLDP